MQFHPDFFQKIQNRIIASIFCHEFADNGISIAKGFQNRFYGCKHLLAVWQDLRIQVISVLHKFFTFSPSLKKPIFFHPVDNGLLQLFGRSDIHHNGFQRWFQNNILIQLFHLIRKVNFVKSGNTPNMMKGALSLIGKKPQINGPIADSQRRIGVADQTVSSLQRDLLWQFTEIPTCNSFFFPIASDFIQNRHADCFGKFFL